MSIKKIIATLLYPVQDAYINDKAVMLNSNEWLSQSNSGLEIDLLQLTIFQEQEIGFHGFLYTYTRLHHSSGTGGCLFKRWPQDRKKNIFKRSGASILRA